MPSATEINNIWERPRVNIDSHTQLFAQRLDVVEVDGLGRWATRRRRRQRSPSDRDLLVGGPVLLAGRRRIPGPLNARAGRARHRALGDVQRSLLVRIMRATTINDFAWL